ncbi:hypothetical protein [Sulfurisphaera ohwakuensis]|uniref:Uncharacterized protein n=1 Tax=Sulfurisphaera ohwakuensis TaxID=69656 RepID=A0A650CK30_SULOH|nr:hypothetical protein [Sulfurisphaera ohwakuensis]MBB5255214.1 hypothetical protein [Sulfurisphaera ohwakuensis]QGR18234.1 hypothetical protein D1869_14335 [Sulfurisphaera ohwakuensis]
MPTATLPPNVTPYGPVYFPQQTGIQEGVLISFILITIAISLLSFTLFDVFRSMKKLKRKPRL